MIAWIGHVWKVHGTKVIGFGTTLVGALALLDHETLDVISTALGPTNGPRLTRGLLVLSGLATAYRGFQNSRPKETP